MSEEKPAGFARSPAADRIALGERLRRARDYLGLSQEEVARASDLSRSALSNIETGVRKIAALELQTLARVYRRPVGYFTGEEEIETDLPEDVAHLARAASDLSLKDREELQQFAEFLRARARQRKQKDG